MAEAKTSIKALQSENAKLRAQLARVVKLLEVSNDLHAKQSAVLEELDNVLAGKASIGEKMRAFSEGFALAWASRYAPGAGAGAYVWKKDRDFKHVKDLAKKLEPEDLVERAQRYIRSEDPFFVKARHEFGLFVQSINRWARAADAPEDLELDSAPADCRHTPRCKDDAAHTARKQAELRASA